MWCANEGIVANSSVIDACGWDFLLEIPFPPGKNHRDIHAADINCKVQVKATDGKSKKWSIGLANLKNLATNPFPVFFAFLEFERQATPQRAFLVHLDQAWITKILKRVHEEVAVNESRVTNKKTISIGYEKAHELNISKGKFLRAAIENHVGDMHAYVEKKKKHLERTGFEGGSSRLQFRTLNEKNLMDLIDVSIGAKESVEVSDFVGHDVRFGMPGREPVFEVKTGVLTMPEIQATGLGVFSIHDESLPSPLKFNCKYFTSPFMTRLPQKMWKLRIEGKSFEIVLTPATGATFATVHLSDARLSVRDLRDHLKLMKLLFSSNKGVRVEFAPEAHAKIELTLNSGKESFPFDNEIVALESAKNVLHHFDQIESFDITLTEIHRQANQVNAFSETLRNNYSINLDFSVSSDGFDPGRPVACILVMLTSIGRHKLGMILAVKSDQSAPRGAKFILLNPLTSVERTFFADPGEELERQLIQTYIVAASKKYEDKYQIVRMAGFYRGVAPAALAA